jgi:hypothetical protein
VTDRGWTTRQPDETPVGELPLRSAVRNALRFGGVLTLGQLRAMGDRQLMTLRNFGRVALADVRLLVPAPAGSWIASTGGVVTIASRTFILGAVYAPRPGSYGHEPRRLLRYTADSLLSGGRVTVAILSSGRRQIMAGTEWAAWAGEPVGDGSGKVGR